jgi:tripartite-type tricarboxylate transporter receptor subunit TctC
LRRHAARQLNKYDKGESMRIRVHASPFAIFAAAALLIVSRADAQQSFFKGKTMHIIVGGPAGGGFDTYARMIARQMPKHIPGSPTIVVNNMPGAGMMIAANHVYKMAKADGLTIGHFTGSQTISQILNNPGVEFDMRKFYYLGAPTADHFSCAFTKASGITSAEKWLASTRPAKMGGIGPGNLTDNTIRVLRTATNLPIQLVSGYPGTAPIRLALESGEIEGSCWGWDSIRSTWANALQTGQGMVVIQAAAKRHADLPNVPLAIDFGKNADGKQLIDVIIHGGNIVERTFLLPPGVPRERAEMLKSAFAKTLADPEFLAEAQKAKLGVAPVTGEELERRVNAFFKLPDDLKRRIKRVLYE